MSASESIIGFESIVGQEKPIRLLTTLFQNETIPHALLFLGADGVGKKITATAFAMACNCRVRRKGDFSANPKIRADHLTIPDRTIQGGPGDCCPSCRKIKSGSHPDVILVEPSGAFIRIDQIRSLCSTLAMKPYEAKLRVVIISDAQAMNPSAGNALLKVLEEPPDKTILILTAMQTSDLLPTIVSRCQHIRFNPIPRKHLEALLVEKRGMHPDDAKIIAAMANGSVSKAFSMTSKKNPINWINRRIWLIDEVQSLFMRPMAARLAFAARLSKDNKALGDSLEVLKTWFRDLVVWKYHSGRILNTDLKNKIQRASLNMTVASILSKINNIHAAQKNIRANTNLRLTLEVLVMRLAKV
ncbi:MAG: DNA polymerase III subunit delta' [Deltaproteobacteria bacterium]|nr:DNA polymerase III subunit delta' [Deltaproteobacteria bacterium]MBW1747005.1 DNA polymerase III subunit delta' [Deltaproteobacteria bacterium]MBW1825558.1 DNA polymerase III subunit delta' [Deltaproteobacteria bacterium]MBW1968524.1 DNA polymerase III subunit delta' [Deltaproteobacteria bacterium]MBW2155914.1 DNA polymerase III subunit delta' [Deltaproteobacteria bacterium]